MGVKEALALILPSDGNTLGKSDNVTLKLNYLSVSLSRQSYLALAGLRHGQIVVVQCSSRLMQELE